MRFPGRGLSEDLSCLARALGSRLSMEAGPGSLQERTEVKKSYKQKIYSHAGKARGSGIPRWASVRGLASP